jgi:heme a synthase
MDPATETAALAPSLPPPRGPRATLALAKYAWAVLAYNLLVIAWGAYVRASGSGAGCGRHWPLCNGEVVPRAKSVATVVEMTHRATSLLALVAVVIMMIWARRTLPKGHRARRASVVSTVFIFGEALIGAALVLFELVAHDTSMKRGLSMILHLGNTFLLLGALTITAWTLTVEGGAPGFAPAPAPAPKRLALRAVVGLSLAAVLMLGASGAIAALGDTLFPAQSLREGLAQDLSPLAHVFLRLRVLHPFVALATGALVFASAAVVRALSAAPRARTLSRLVTVVFATQFAVGLVNVTLLAPIAMQIVHLLMADATWIALALMGWEALYAPPAHDVSGSEDGSVGLGGELLSPLPPR